MSHRLRCRSAAPPCRSRAAYAVAPVGLPVRLRYLACRDCLPRLMGRLGVLWPGRVLRRAKLRHA